MSSPSNDRKSPSGLQGRDISRQIASIRPDADKLLYVPDVQALLRNGKSAWWVRNNFAPEHRIKVGRSPAWWLSDALTWLSSRVQR